MAENITLGTVSSFANDSSAVAIVNNNSQLIENAFQNVLDRYGTAPNGMQAVLDMNNFNIINLPAPATINSPVRLVDVISPGVSLTVPPIGTSGATVGLLNGNNTYSGSSTFTGVINSSNTNTWSGVNNFTNASNTAKFLWVNSPGLSIPIEQYGGAGDNSTDNSVAFNAIIAAFPNQSLSISFGTGTYLFKSSISVTLPNAICAISFIGLGTDVSILTFNSGFGISLNYQSYYNSALFQNLTLATNGTGTGTGVTITQTGTTTSVAIEAITNFDNVVFRGSDGYVLNKYWLTAVNLIGVSDTLFTNVYIAGVSGSTYSTVGTGVSVSNPLVGNAPVNTSFENCIFNYVGTGVVYGNFAEGIFFTNTNFTGCNIGINVPTGIGGLDELTVTNCQFNCKTAGILTTTGVPSFSVSNSLFIIPLSSSTGILMPVAAIFNITGNQFEGPGTFAGAGANAGNGVVIQAIAGLLGGTIVGNSFTGLSSGVWLQSTGAVQTEVNSNFFFQNNIAVLDASTDGRYFNNVGLNPIGPSSDSPSANPWTYTAGGTDEYHYMSDTSGITALTIGGTSILPHAIAANAVLTVFLPARQQMIVTFGGTLTSKKYAN